MKQPDNMSSDHREFSQTCGLVLDELKKWSREAGYPQEYVRELKSAKSRFDRVLAKAGEYTVMPGHITNELMEARGNLATAYMAVLRTLKRYSLLSNRVCLRIGLREDSWYWSDAKDGTEFPLLQVESTGRKVTIHFRDRKGRDKPRWALCANIYRRKIGAKAFELIANAMASPYIDSVAGSPAQYEYMARFRSSSMAGPTPDSEIVRVKASRLKAA